MSRLQANAVLLMAAALWGGGFIAQSDAMGRVGPLWFTVLRFVLACAVLSPLVIVEGRRALRPLDRRDLGLLLLLGATFFIGCTLQQFAILTTSVTHVGFLTGLYVLFVPVLGFAILRQRPHAVIWPAALLALSGTWLLGGGFDRLNSGDLLTILAALSFAGQILLLDAVVKRTGRPTTAIVAQSAFCVIVGLPFALGTEAITLAAVRAITPQLFYAGVLSGGVAFVFQAIGQRSAPAAEAAVLLMAESLFAALFAALLLGEQLTLEGWAGCGLLFTSLVLVQVAPMLIRSAKPAAGLT